MVVLAALVLAQALGAMHRVAHTQGSARTGSLHATPYATQVAVADGASIAGRSMLAALFAGHDVEHACDQYDQLTHADYVSITLAVVSVATLACAPTRFHAGSQLAEQAAGFLARGPPTAV